MKQEDVDYGRHRIDGKAQRGYKSLGLTDDVPDLDKDDGDGGTGGYSILSSERVSYLGR